MFGILTNLSRADNSGPRRLLLPHLMGQQKSAWAREACGRSWGIDSLQKTPSTMQGLEEDHSASSSFFTFFLPADGLRLPTLTNPVGEDSPMMN